MKTEQQVVNHTMHVHAIPKSSHQLQNLEDGELPYSLKLWEYDSYGNDETAYIGEVDVTYILPGGVDLRAGVIESLENTLVKKTKEFEAEKEKIENRIKELRLIGYDPNPREI